MRNQFRQLAGALAFLAVVLTVSSTNGKQAQLSPEDKKVLVAFENRVKDYVKLRKMIVQKLPKLTSDSKPEQIEAHKTAFQEQVRLARSQAKPGDIFAEDIAPRIRHAIKTAFNAKERREIRETVLAADTRGVPLRVNYAYPETKELTQIPPTLLLELPQLPEQLRYRFVGQHLLLVDRETNVIVDYMLKALP